MTQVAVPFRIDARGRTAVAGDADHLRNLIEQVLFTAPGERVNRPAFGSGLRGLVFAPGGDAIAGTAQATVQASLQEFLGELVEVEDVTVAAGEGRVTVSVAYTVRQTRAARVDRFERPAA